MVYCRFCTELEIMYTEYLNKKNVIRVRYFSGTEKHTLILKIIYRVYDSLCIGETDNNQASAPKTCN
jgi:hypothetical protein